MSKPVAARNSRFGHTFVGRCGSFLVSPSENRVFSVAGRDDPSFAIIAPTEGDCKQPECRKRRNSYLQSRNNAAIPSLDKNCGGLVFL